MKINLINNYRYKEEKSSFFISSIVIKWVLYRRNWDGQKERMDPV